MSDKNDNGWGVAQNAAKLHRTAMVWDNHGGFAYERASRLEELSRWASSGVDYLSIKTLGGEHAVAKQCPDPFIDVGSKRLDDVGGERLPARRVGFAGSMFPARTVM